MRRSICLLCVLLPAAGVVQSANGTVDTWEKQELVLTSGHTYANPYTDVTVWVDLTGPGFHKRVYGFWDGDRTFRVRVVATAPGEWKRTSGSTACTD